MPRSPPSSCSRTTRSGTATTTSPASGGRSASSSCRPRTNRASRSTFRRGTPEPAGPHTSLMALADRTCPPPMAQYGKEYDMSGLFGGRFAAGMIALTLAASACDYDGTGSGTGYGDGSIGTVRFDAKVFTASGDLTAVLADFRATLGDPANRDSGEVATGRREVNWDGVSGANLNVNTFPADFFNRVVRRGQ